MIPSAEVVRDYKEFEALRKEIGDAAFERMLSKSDRLEDPHGG